MAKIFDLVERAFLDDKQNGLCMAAVNSHFHLLKVGRYHIQISPDEAKKIIETWSAPSTDGMIPTSIVSNDFIAAEK